MRNLYIYRCWVLIASLVDFILMGVDKVRAKRGSYRIPERALLLVGLFGGSLGGILGMRIFHHKTRHWYFRYGLPIMLGLQLVGLVIFLC